MLEQKRPPSSSLPSSSLWRRREDIRSCMGIFVALDVVIRLLHTNHFLKWFYNDPCQYISDFYARIRIKKRIVLV